MPQSLQQSRPESQTRIVELNLDQAMAAEALSECLTLLAPHCQPRPASLSPEQWRDLAPQLVLRISYALLQAEPKFCRSELHELAKADLLRAQALLHTQERLRSSALLRR